MYKLSFYNSRTKSIDEFVHDLSIPINIYTCGPTVYDRVHLGNLKTFLWSDFVVSYLQSIGYLTNHIMNITDIDDKIISRIPEQTHVSLIEYTSFYTKKFLEDIEKLGIRNYTIENIHKVTDNVDSIEDMIVELKEKGFAYETLGGSVYFDSSKISNNPFYVNNQTDGYEGTRNIVRADGVKSDKDFVLWKIMPEREIGWGYSRNLKKGCVGWDSECCALSNKLLGKVHIKMGGSDLKSKHHCNEISQAEALYPDRVYGNYWIHFGFLNFSGEKMSKSIGNVLKLDDIVHNYKLVRMYLLTKSYKNDVDYSEDEIVMLKKDFINLHMLYSKLANKFYRTNKNPQANYLGDVKIYDKILGIISCNFSTGDAIKELIKYIDKFMKVYLTDEKAQEIKAELDLANGLLNIIDWDLLEIDDQTRNFISLREELRVQKQFVQTDLMREELKKNFIFEDENTGFSLIKKLN